MMYAIGMSQYDDELKESIDKIDKALFMTPCFASDFLSNSVSINRVAFAFVRQMYGGDGPPFVLGEGSDREADLKVFTQGVDDETAALLELFIDLGDSLSKQTMLDASITDAEEAMTKVFFEDYGVDRKYPEESDLIDFTTLASSPELHHFITSNDITCHMTSLEGFEADMGDHVVKKIDYNCPTVSHEWFSYRGSGQ